jgi:LuxR family maltose regulon positive regulatory protein
VVHGFTEGPLDAARFDIPQLPPFHVARSGVFPLLESSATESLVLVSAPAGTGKTSAVAEWVRDAGTREVGWVAFENDDVTFWRYVIQCLARLGVDVPEAWSPPADACLGRERLLALSVLVAEMPRRITVVLDGYELVSRELGNEIDFLLRHTEGRLRLVLIGRVDPVFPLYRYAISGSLVEVRAAQLAFDDEEATELLASAGVSMVAASVRELNLALQGWAAGLRLAARALSGRPDPEDRVAAVVLRTSALTEFLIEEVLNRQPQALRQIMLDTAVPDVLSPGLVEEIAGSAAPRSFDRFAELKSLVEPEVGQPGWFRYPPFVRELLRAQLVYEDPDRVVEVHRRAARWLRREGRTLESLSHLSTAGDWDDVVAGFIDGMTIGQLLVEGPSGALAAIAQRVPDDLEDTAACVVRAAGALATGDEKRCDRELVAAIAADPGAERAGALGLSLVAVQALRASRSGDAATAALVAATAEGRLDQEQVGMSVRAVAEVSAVVQLSKGIAALRQGDLAVAGEALERAAEQAPVTAAASFRADCLGRLAIVEALEGHLSHAVRSAHASLTCAGEGGLSAQETPPAARVALALVGTDRVELDVAREHAQAALASPLLAGDPTCRGLLETATAELERADGAVDVAIQRLERAAAQAAPGDPWLADHLRLESARLSVADGHPEQALALLESIEDTERPDVAVVAAAAYEEQGASVAVDGLLAKVQASEATLSAKVSGLLVESLHRSRQKSPGRARQTLDKALHQARPEGLRRPFLDAGPAVQRWLAADPHFAHGSAWLDAAAGAEVRRPEPADHGVPLVVVESLTAKELEVLVLLAELLNTDEIAEKMFVSVNTVRTHIRSILRKLGVSRRNAAIRRARELGILEH